MLGTQSDRAATLLAQLAEELSAADTELRDLASGIYPPELVDFGIEGALRIAAHRCSLPTAVHASKIGRFNPETEINVYFCCLEALQNAVKHAGAGANVTIVLRQQHGLVFEVRDTGHGCDSTTLEAGHGYANMHDRLSAIGGELTVHAQSGLGVQIRGHIAWP
jgi:signal transduction histidine kinase